MLNRNAPATDLRIGGFTPLTTIDFPDHLSAVVFCQGCPWRCAYCHNEHLLPAQTGAPAAGHASKEHSSTAHSSTAHSSAEQWSGIEHFLHQRRGLLDAVVFSGGEPTAQAALGAAMRSARALGFRIGLHTGGAYPDRFADVLPLCDWVGFDVKTLAADYDALTATRGAGARAWTALERLLESGVEYEVRTTLHWSLLSRDALLQLAEELAKRGVQRWLIQPCQTRHGLARNLPLMRWSSDDEQWCLQELGRFVPHLAIRAA